MEATSNQTEVGKKYICKLNGEALYEAEIKNFSKCGCWATVEIIKPLDGPHKENYFPGQVFDIKIARYGTTEIK